MRNTIDLSRSLSLVVALASSMIVGCPSSSNEAPPPDAANLSVDSPAKGNAALDNAAASNATPSDNATLNNVSSGSASNTESGSEIDTASTEGVSNINATNNGFKNNSLNNTPMNSAASNTLANAPANSGPPPNFANSTGLEGTNNVFNANSSVAAVPPANSAPPFNSTPPPPNNAIPPIANAAQPPINVPQGNNLTDPVTAPVTPPDMGLADAALPPPEPPKSRPNYKEVTEEELAMWRQAAEKLRNLAPGEYPAEYIVQPGDTLWDICDQFLDDAFWWPKLWTMNPSIQNPNIIEPGQKLIFQPSGGVEPPTLAVRDIGQAEMVPVDSKVISEVGGTLAHPWVGKEGVLLDPSELSSDPTIVLFGAIIPPTALTVPVPGFLSSSSPSEIGTIVGGGDSPIISSKGRVAYAKMDNPPAAGERFLALREMPHTNNPNGKESSGPTPYFYTAVLGVLKNHKNGLTQFVVEETPFDGAAPGDYVMPYKNIYQFVEPALSRKVASIRAEVVATSATGGRMAGVGNVVFLEPDEGTPSPGDDIELFMPEGGIVDFENDNDLDGHLAAKARVLEVTENSISAVIISATREVTIGARTWAEF